MTAKRKTKKKLKRPSRPAGKKPTKRSSAKKIAPVKKKTAKKKTTKKKLVRRAATAKPKSGGKRPKAAKRKTPRPIGRETSPAADVARVVPISPRGSSGDEAGDLQGLSRAERADSESVDELLEEGNAFEAETVMGVEEADNADEQEVHTHEVPEDDVPDEYLDDDR